MSNGWQTKTLGDVFEIGSSRRVLKSEWKSEGVPFYRGREVTKLAKDDHVNNELFISEEHYSDLLKKSGVPAVGDILITAIGTIGNCYIVRENDRFYFKDASVLWMKKSSEINSDFIRYWLMSSLFFDQLDKGNGATVDTLTIKKMQTTKISIPPLPEQKRIVSILDSAFASLEKAKVNAEKNLQNANELFESFLQTVFENPKEDWVQDLLLNLTSKIGSGATPTGGQKSYKNKGISLIRSLNVHDDGFKNKNLAFIDEKQAQKLSNVTIQSGDVLLNITGASITRCCVVPDDVLPARVNQHVSILRPLQESILPEFLHSTLISKVYKSKLLSTGEEGGATRQALTKTQLQNFTIKFPSSTLKQKEILKYINNHRHKSLQMKKNYTDKLYLLDELKQSLLSKAFSGEL